jgi:hypothetical protein
METSSQEKSIHLFRKLALATGENALTEALAATLRVSSFLRNEFLRNMGIEGCEIEVATQPKEYSEGIPDLRLQSFDCLILIEVKLTAPLTRDQWDKYRAILDRQSYVSTRRLAGIVGPNTCVDIDLLTPTLIGAIWYWTDVYRWVVNARAKERDAVARFVLSEFADFLEGLGMAPFQGFGQADLDILGQLHGLYIRIEAFLREVVETLSKLLSPPLRAKSGGFRWETYKGDPVMYLGATFDVLDGRVPLRGWIAVKLSPDQFPFVLYLWSDSSDPEVVAKVNGFLSAIDLEYDKYEAAHYCLLKTRLVPTESAARQVGDLAEEISGIVMKVFAH